MTDIRQATAGSSAETEAGRSSLGSGEHVEEGRLKLLDKNLQRDEGLHIMDFVDQSSEVQWRRSCMRNLSRTEDDFSGAFPEQRGSGAIVASRRLVGNWDIETNSLIGYPRPNFGKQAWPGAAVPTIGPQFSTYGVSTPIDSASLLPHTLDSAKHFNNP